MPVKMYLKSPDKKEKSKCKLYFIFLLIKDFLFFFRQSSSWQWVEPEGIVGNSRRVLGDFLVSFSPFRQVQVECWSGVPQVGRWGLVSVLSGGIRGQETVKERRMWAALKSL